MGLLDPDRDDLFPSGSREQLDMVAGLEDFIENARLFIFETFSRIHQCISISVLPDELHTTPEEAERWILNLIRNARFDAEMDSKLARSCSH
ncbi:unnamed protein product [Pleuronectes platessa]|uniref:PCI domain-containing protein n=1 Tax=Pleuronectes platessa TaxID=8262 RepID=A0A9N7YK58_PLEPL|nr:unnamed protein product [Pleuronectes platessa]